MLLTRALFITITIDPDNEYTMPVLCLANYPRLPKARKSSPKDENEVRKRLWSDTAPKFIKKLMPYLFCKWQFIIYFNQLVTIVKQYEIEPLYLASLKHRNVVILWNPFHANDLANIFWHNYIYPDLGP